MNIVGHVYWVIRAPAWAKPVFAVGLAVLSTGCATNNARTVYDEPTLRPGETVICESNPCSDYFDTPAGSGTHTVFVGGGTVKAGEAIGGQRVFLGQYYGGEKVFKVDGTDLPEAYLNVLGRGQ